MAKSRKNIKNLNPKFNKGQHHQTKPVQQASEVETYVEQQFASSVTASIPEPQPTPTVPPTPPVVAVAVDQPNVVGKIVKKPDSMHLRIFAAGEEPLDTMVKVHTDYWDILHDGDEILSYSVGNYHVVDKKLGVNKVIVLVNNLEVYVPTINFQDTLTNITVDVMSNAEELLDTKTYQLVDKATALDFLEHTVMDGLSEEAVHRNSNQTLPAETILANGYKEDLAVLAKNKAFVGFNVADSTFANLIAGLSLTNDEVLILRERLTKMVVLNKAAVMAELGVEHLTNA